VQVAYGSCERLSGPRIDLLRPEGHSGGGKRKGLPAPAIGGTTERDS
jgi:hypothetical protein